MKISKALIEKYHNGTCTKAEVEFVEAWLLHDEFDEEELPISIDKTADGKKIWQNIVSEIDKPQKQQNKLKLIAKIAASVLIVLTAGLSYYFLFAQQGEKQLVVFNNNSRTELKNIDHNSCFITMAPKSTGKIDLKAGLFNFCGNLLLSPKNDIEISFNGKEKVKLKNGQTYIILSNECPSGNPIIVNEKDILNLPPLIQRQLVSQFSI
jgi:hypothetical protein